MPQENKVHKELVSLVDIPSEHHRPIFKRVILGTLLFIAAVIVLNIVFYIIGFRSGFFHRWAEGQKAGVVTEIRSDGFTIVGRDGMKKTVFVDEGTIIKKERDLVGIDALKIGLQVIIIGDSRDESLIDAHTIRIFRDDDFRGSTHSPPF